MGSLYTGTNKPASSGLLARITVDVVPTTVTIAANTARGGVVMERAGGNSDRDVLYLYNIAPPVRLLPDRLFKLQRLEDCG